MFVSFQMCFLVKSKRSAAEFPVKVCSDADSTSGKAGGGQRGLDGSVSGSMGGRLTVNVLFGRIETV